MVETIEGTRINDWLKKEIPGFSRETVTVLAGSGSDRVLTSGMILGSTVSGLTGAIREASGNTGDGVVDALTLKAGAQAGTYILRGIAEAANLGTFAVTAPDGSSLPDLTVDTAYVSDHLDISVADGAADWDIDDIIIIVVSGARKVVQLDLDGVDGSEKAVGVLLQDVTAPDTVDTPGVAVTRNAWVASQEVTFPAAATAAEKDAVLADLRQNGILIAQNMV